MVIKSIFLILVIESVICYPNDIIRRCKKTDEVCIANSAKHAMLEIFKGVPELNVKPTDPLNLELVVGDLSTLKYTFTDAVTTGFLHCDIFNVKLNLEEPLLRFNLTCPKLTIKGKYKISGQLIILPIEGEGPFQFDLTKYDIGFVGEPKIVEGKDGKKHMTIKRYQAHGEPKGGVHFDLQNLFGGRKDLGDTVLKFANENWKEVSDFVQGPLLDKTVKEIVINVNKFFKSVPLEDLYLA